MADVIILTVIRIVVPIASMIWVSSRLKSWDLHRTN
jgi:hypothetical protein